MSAAGIFFKEHYKVMLIGLSITLVGIFVNWCVGKNSNRILLKKLTAELDTLNAKPVPTAEEQRHMNYLLGEIYILKFKL